jgi:hypothetical protein
MLLLPVHCCEFGAPFGETEQFQPCRGIGLIAVRHAQRDLVDSRFQVDRQLALIGKRLRIDPET